MEPLYEWRKLISRLEHSLIYYGQSIANPGVSVVSASSEASKELRYLSTILQPTTNHIPAYNALSFLRLLPPHKDVVLASKDLMFVSNNVFHSATQGLGNPGIENADAVDRIKSLLRLRVE